MADLSVIILSFNRIEQFAANIKRFTSAANLREIELILVDNGSNDGTSELIDEVKRDHPSVIVLSLPANIGVAAGRNAGIKLASGRYIVCLDDDAVVEMEDIYKVPGLFESNPQAGILAFRVWDYHAHRWTNNMGDIPTQIGNFHGSGHAFRRSLFDKVGYLDEQCVYGAEELDMSIRARDAGFTTLYTPNITVVHSKRQPRDADLIERRNRYISNFVRVIYKHFPPHLAFKFALRSAIQHWIKGARNQGLGITPAYFAAARAGAALGLAAHRDICPETLRFYERAATQPYYGNSSLVVRAIVRVLRFLKKQYMSAQEIDGASPESGAVKPIKRERQELHPVSHGD